MTYFRKAYAYYSVTGYYGFVVSGLRTGASEILIEARNRGILISKIFWSSAGSMFSNISFSRGKVDVVCVYSSNKNGRLVHIHANNLWWDSGGKTLLDPYFSCWRAKPFEMFRTSEIYLATTGIRSPILSDRSLVIILIKLPRFADQRKSNLTFN
jgi:hypothetical protein